MINDFVKKYSRAKKEVDQIIKKISRRRADNIYTPLYRAMEYSLFTGGKRVRPIIVKWVAELGKPDPKILENALTSIEYIHTYSLIHDDLPALDNDDYRRDSLTTHKKFSEGMAILAGDALLTEAFNILYSTGNIELVGILSNTAGPLGMVGGQAADIKDDKELSNEYINKLKTARLFEASARMGAAAGELDNKRRKKIKNYGINIGRAFQLKDDILDRESKNKDKTIREAKKIIKKAKKQLEGLENLGTKSSAEKLRELADFVIKRDK